MSKPKIRLDQLLLQLGHFADPKIARGWIMAGKVVVDGAVVTSAGTKFPPTADIHLRAPPLKYASRGGYKLERALQRFGVDVRGKVCLDAGASAGGFTDCLLQHGAEKVYAVEVGFGQLKGKLAADPRVVVLERTNIAEFRITDADAPIRFAAIDLSYLSLGKAIPLVAGFFRGEPDLVGLIKPLYEGLAQQNLANPAAIRDILPTFFTTLTDAGFAPTAVCVSPIFGGRGAIEFLARFGPGDPLSPAAATDAALLDLAASPPVSPEAFVTPAASS